MADQGFFQGRVSSEIEYNDLGMTRCLAKKSECGAAQIVSPAWWPALDGLGQRSLCEIRIDTCSLRRLHTKPTTRSVGVTCRWPGTCLSRDKKTADNI